MQTSRYRRGRPSASGTRCCPGAFLFLHVFRDSRRLPRSHGYIVKPSFRGDTCVITILGVDVGTPACAHRLV